jgi:hypothetical protein
MSSDMGFLEIIIVEELELRLTPESLAGFLD